MFYQALHTQVVNKLMLIYMLLLLFMSHKKITYYHTQQRMIYKPVLYSNSGKC